MIRYVDSQKIRKKEKKIFKVKKTKKNIPTYLYWVSKKIVVDKFFKYLEKDLLCLQFNLLLINKSLFVF